MQPGVSHLIAPGLSIAEFARQAAAAGYEVIELCMRPDGELTPFTSDHDLRALAASIRSEGVEPVSIVHGHISGNLLESGEAQRTAIEETIGCLQAAAAMGIGCTLHTLGSLSPGLFYDRAYEHGIAALKEVASAAERLQVTVAVEFVWSGFLFSPLEMRRFLDEVGSERIGFYFDPGNTAVFQYPQHWARIVGPHIKMVHLKDWRGHALDGGWPALCKGDIDFAAVNRELRTAGYNGPMISEVSLDEASLQETALAIRGIMAL